MKIRNFVIIIFIISIISCATTATVINSYGYIITYDPSGDGYYKQVFCNDQPAYAFYNTNEFYHLFQVRYSPVDKIYVALMINYEYKFTIDQILPLDVAEAQALMIAQNAGFNSYVEYAQNHYLQTEIAERERRQQEIERIAEANRLRSEIDNSFGVIAIGSLLHAKSGGLEIGDIIRLGDTFSYNTNNWARSNRGGFLFGEFLEFEIIGLDMREVNVNVTEPSRTGYFVQGGNITAGGRKGYIVKYLGTEDIITQAGLRRVLWVFECIGGNIYAQ